MSRRPPRMWQVGAGAEMDKALGQHRAEEPAEEPTEAPPATTAETPARPADALRKLTVPFRVSQLDRLGRILARWQADREIRAAAAEVIRLAVDDMLDRLERDPDSVIEDLLRQEREEKAAGIARQFGRLRVPGRGQ